MTRSYRPNAKGETESSYQKHELIKHVVEGQTGAATTILQKYQSALIVDLHAGDGHGVSPAQIDLFNASESAPTALVALAAAERLAHHCRVGLRLFERDRDRRNSLHNEIYRRNPCLDTLSIEADHKTLQDFAFFRGYDYVLAISDPNGPKAAGVEILEGIARQRQGRPLDVVAVVNIGALSRLRGLPRQSSLAAVRAARRAYDERYWWHEKPEEWARRLHRQLVLATSPFAPLGHGAMKGRIFLVTNFAARPPRGFRFEFNARDARFEAGTMRAGSRKC